MPLGISNSPELTREQVVAMLHEPLLAQSVFLRAGPRIFEASGGVPIRIPTVIAYEIGTGTSASAHVLAPRERVDRRHRPRRGRGHAPPSTLKSIKVLHRFSNELARHAVVDIANALRDAIVRRVAPPSTGRS